MVDKERGGGQRKGEGRWRKNKKRKEYLKDCKIEFMKHVFPRFWSPAVLTGYV